MFAFGYVAYWPVFIITISLINKKVNGNLYIFKLLPQRGWIRWRPFNSHWSLFAQHSWATLARCVYFPSNTRALAVPMWPSSVSRTVAPASSHPPPPPPAQTDLRHCRNPRPVQQATGGRLNSFTRFSGGGGEKEEKKEGGRAGFWEPI